MPELVGFTKLQRRFIVCGAVKLLRKERPSAIVLAGLPGLGAILGFFTVYAVLEAFPINPIAIFCGGFLFGVIIGSNIGAHIFQIFMRPYYKRFIEEHQENISALE